jgi:DNA-binding NarL/FixJ family response regulator
VSSERTKQAAAPTVVIADDHPPTRSLLRQALQGGGLDVIGEASDAREAVRLVLQSQSDLALLDVRMPGGGIAAAAAIAQSSPRTAVVMLTVSEDEEDLFAALRVGALGYVLKGGSPSELPNLLRRAMNGEAVLHGALVARVLTEFQAYERDRLFSRSDRELLSQREYEVLMLLEQGATTAEIAERLFVAKVTVRSHIAAICRKLRLGDRESLVREVRASRSRTKTGLLSYPLRES